MANDETARDCRSDEARDGDRGGPRGDGNRGAYGESREDSELEPLALSGPSFLRRGEDDRFRVACAYGWARGDPDFREGAFTGDVFPRFLSVP